MSVAALIRSMAAAGATPEAIAIAVEAIEAAEAKVEERRAAARERKRRQRERDSHGTVTGQSLDEPDPVTGQSPKTKVSPTPPSKTQTPKFPPYSPPKNDLDGLAEHIWSLQPKVEGKRRQTKPDVKRALGPVLRKHDPERVVAACRAYYALPASLKDGGAYAMGAARLLQNDRWLEFEPGAAEPVAHLAPATNPFPEPEIRAAVVTAKGEGFARSYLDPCAWDGEQRQIVPRTGVAAAKLRAEVFRVLQARKASIHEAAA